MFDPETLLFGSHDATSQTFEWDTPSVDDDPTHAWFNTTTVEDYAGVERTVVVSDNQVIGVFGTGENAGTWYRSYQWEHYYDEHLIYPEDESEAPHLDPAAMDMSVFGLIFAMAPPYPQLGPMNRYWWPCDAVERNPNGAAAELAGLPVCVVTFPTGEAGIALTDGGMDMTWYLVEAYARLGQLPPAALARDLKPLGSRGNSPADRSLIAAALRTLQHREDEARKDRAALQERFSAVTPA